MNDGTDAASRSCIEAEELAAFIDGRLVGEARERALRHVDACAECFDVVAGALHVKEEVVLEDLVAVSATEPGLQPTGPRRLDDDVDVHDDDEREPRPPLIRMLFLAAAAGLAAVVLVPALFGPTDLSNGAVVADLLHHADPAALVGGIWSPSGRWSVMRDPRYDGLDTSARSFRLGVRALDYELALAAGDAATAASTLDDVRSLLDRLPIDADGAAAYGEIADQLAAGAPDLPAVRRASAAAEPALERAAAADWYTLGRDLEAGRLAAVSGDVRYLRQRRFRRAVDAGRKIDGGERVRSDLVELRRLLDGVDEAALPAVRAALATAIEHGGNVPAHAAEGGAPSHEG